MSNVTKSANLQHKSTCYAPKGKNEYEKKVLENFVFQMGRHTGTLHQVYKKKEISTNQKFAKYKQAIDQHALNNSYPSI